MSSVDGEHLAKVVLVHGQKFGLPAAQIGSSHLLRTTFLSKTANYLFISTSTTKTVGKPLE
jgi:hypothetical protein